MKITLLKMQGYPFNASISFKNKFESELKFEAQSASENYYEEQLGRTLRVGKIPIPYTMGLFYLVPTFDFYGYYATEGTVTLNFDAHVNRTDELRLEYYNGTWTSTHIPTNDIGIDVASLSMSGYAEVGIKADILLGLNGTRSGIGLTVSTGVKYSIDCIFDALKYTGSGLYEAIKDSRMHTTIPCKVNAFAQLGLFGKDCPSWQSPEWASEPQWGSDKYILPNIRFNVLPFSNSPDWSIEAYLERDLLMPIRIGHGVETLNGEVVDVQWDNKEYQNEGSYTRYNGIADSLYSHRVYRSYPCIQIMGLELRATPVYTFLTKCPDDNHPHAIDLGLPSGTKWACWNVGTYMDGKGFLQNHQGNSFAWGETEAKSDFSVNNYQYAYEESGVINYTDIGTDIARTGYDVASVKWGSNWQMPTRAQAEELSQNCIWTRADNHASAWSENDHFVTGPNGNGIVLQMPVWGGYWCSTIKDESRAYYLQNNGGCGSKEKWFGNAVRPVAKYSY